MKIKYTLSNGLSQFDVIHNLEDVENGALYSEEMHEMFKGHTVIKREIIDPEKDALKALLNRCEADISDFNASYFRYLIADIHAALKDS